MFKKMRVILIAGILILGISQLSFAMMCGGHSEDQQMAQAHTEDEHGVKVASEETVLEEAVNAGNKICPVSGEKIDDKMKTTYEYEGKIYNFCCPACIEDFKKDPAKYTSKIKEIKLETFQFGFSPDPVKVKKGDIVRLEITSRDVAHGVYIKEYGINVAIKKGENKKIEFLADKVGEFDILCSVFCGSGHSKMKGKLVVGK